MKKPKLIRDWRSSYRWYSQQAAGLQVALAGNTSATGAGGVAVPPNVSSRVVSTSQIRVQQHANVDYSTFYVWIAGGF